jgi:hypothetical protein
MTSPPMTLGNMRELGVDHLIAFFHNDACRHQGFARRVAQRPLTPSRSQSTSRKLKWC